MSDQGSDKLSSAERSQEDAATKGQEDGRENESRDEEADIKHEHGGLSPTREALFILCVCMAQFLSLAGLAQTIAPLSIIGRSFGVTSEARLSWYPAAFSLTVGAFILPAGRLGDMYGHKTLYQTGLLWYAVASVIAGVSVYSGDILFSVARALQGIGCALLVPNALALVGRQYGDSPKKNMIFALFGAAAPTGWVAGNTFASIFAQLAWWPWAFFAMTFTCLVVAVAAQLIIPADEKHSTEVGGFDILGCLTGVSGLVLFNFAWNQAAVVGWSTVYNYVLLIVGLLLLAAFAFVEIKVAKYPLVPLRGFRGEAALALAVVSAGWGSFGVWMFYLWRLIESLRGYTALSACAQNSPIAILGIIAAVTTGLLLSHIKVSVVLLISTLFFLTAQILMATVPVEQTYWAQTFVAIFLMPFGMDMSFPSATILLSNSTPKHDQGIASSLINTAVNYSISLGLGIAGTIVRQIEASGANTITAYRGAWYLGIGLDVLAVAIASYFVLVSRR